MLGEKESTFQTVDSDINKNDTVVIQLNHFKPPKKPLKRKLSAVIVDKLNKKSHHIHVIDLVSRVLFPRFDYCHTCDSTSHYLTVTPQCVTHNDYHHDLMDTMQTIHQ